MTAKQNWPRQRSFLRKFWNPLVNDWFKDIDPDILPSNATGRQAARAACLIGSDDSRIAAQLSVTTFQELRRSVESLPKVAGVLYEDIDREITYRPKVTMFFQQDSSSVPDYEDPEGGIISFRLIDETSESLTVAKLKSLAREIKTEFAAGNGYLWKKGRIVVSTRNQKIGLPQKIFCLNETEGKEVYQKVFRILDKSYDKDLLNVKTPERKSVTNPTGSKRILGLRVKVKKWRPVVNVRFQYAAIKIHGIVQPIVLVDRSKTYYQAFEYL
ncbi:MAG: hypothetical protein AAGG02_18355 [Cyanobacteria bacterium P01_H01_bin.15]